MRSLIFSLSLTLLGLSSNLAAAAITDPELEKVLKAYVAQRGGHASVKALNSVKYEGTLMDDGKHVADVIIIQKQPNLVRLTMQKGERKITMAFDGTNIWMRKHSNGERARGNAISAEQGYNLVRESDFIDSLVSYLGSSNQYELVGEETIAGNIETYVIKVLHANVPGYEQYYIDKDSYILRKRIVTYPSQNGEKTVESVFGEYDTINGVSIAHKITTWTDGERQQVLQWDTIEPNKGIFNSYFKEPRQAAPRTNP